MTPTPAAAPGLVLDQRYRLERLLGQGGVGVVWEASDLVTGGQVAIKMIRAELFAREDMRRRLRREAKAAAAIDHPNLVRIHGAISGPDGAPALVMERLEGESLDARLALRGKLSTAETASLLLPALVALRAMHARGMVHRDLKPANVFLARAQGSGALVVKLLDFGLVKWVDPNQAAYLSDSLTASGTQIGTPYYMAPEQVLGEATVDPRADVFAAGVVLYECLAGVRPTESSTRAQVFKKILLGTFTPLAEAQSAVPPEIAAEVDRMLARDPEQRPPSLDPVIQILSRYTDQDAVQDVPLRLRRLPWGRWLTASGAALIGLAALLFAKPESVASAVQEPPDAGRPRYEGMVYLPGGDFTMGQSPEAVAAECAKLGTNCHLQLIQREQPARQMKLSPFYIDEVEVTNEQFAAFLNTDPLRIQVKDDLDPPPVHLARYVVDVVGVKLLDLFSETSDVVDDPQGIRLLPGRGNPHFGAVPGKERWPVVQVTWDGARLYCENLGRRLPTEAEWERAARGQTARRYPWGEDAPSCANVVFGRGERGPCSNLPRHPEPVGEAPLDCTSDPRIRDLAGNVSEWVADAFTEGYAPCQHPGCLDERVDPPSTEKDPLMVVRGGNWASDWYLRTTRRMKWHQHSQSPSVGFRCAKNAPEP